MIRDAQVRAEIAASWTSIRKLSKTSHFDKRGPFWEWRIHMWPTELINLPLVLAYCSLEEVLDQLVAEGISDVNAARSILECSRRDLHCRGRTIHWLIEAEWCGTSSPMRGYLSRGQRPSASSRQSKMN